MMFDHHFFVVLARLGGLLWMMAIFAGAVVYACWPGNESKFVRAARSVLDDRD